MNQLWQEAQRHVEARAAVLKELPYAELAALPEHFIEESPDNLPKFEVAVWREVLANQAQRVIVQASRHYLGGIVSRSAVAGFDKHLSGDISELPEGVSE